MDVEIVNKLVQYYNEAIHLKFSVRPKIKLKYSINFTSLCFNKYC
jgi:hypothetical protein